MRNVTLRRLRLASQIFFFALFLFLLIRTEFPGAIRSAALDVRIPWPVGCSSRPIRSSPSPRRSPPARSTATSLWAIPFLLLAILVGRGVLRLDLPARVAAPLLRQPEVGDEARREAHRVEPLQDAGRRRSTTCSPRCCVMAVFGSAAGLLLDPISFMVRSMSVAVLPALNYGAPRGARRRVRPGRSAPLQARGRRCSSAVLSATVLSFKQPHFHQARCSSARLFVFVLVLNLRVTRFWCRAICPLGAMLGVCSRWSLLAAAQARGEVRRLPPLPAALPGRRRPDPGRDVAQGRVPPVPELRGRLPHRRHLRSPGRRGRRPRSRRARRPS